jgi:anti-sigma factor RsiW
VAEQGEGHAAHDPFAVAALLDPDVAPADREVGENLIASCPDCATLHADLVALSSATAGLPAPARPRDFRLTAEDAVRLAASSPGEPVVATARLAGMTPRTSAADHAGHDPLLVASLVDHSLEDRERSAAEALVAACTACAGLHADILALRDATRAMPTPARPRDYALTPDDAVRLRRGGWRRLVAAFGSSRDAFSRPLAMGLTTLGIAGLLFATIPSIYTGGAASGSATTAGARAGDVAQPGTDSNGAPVAAASQGVTGAGAPAPVGAPAATAVPAQVASPLPDAAASAPAATAPAKEAFGPVQGAGGAAAPPSVSDFGIRGGGQGPTGAQALGEGGAATGASGAPLLLVVSGLFLVVGLSLFAIRWSARRLGDG